MKINYCPFCGIKAKQNWQSQIIENLYGFDCIEHGTFIVRKSQEGLYIEADKAGYEPCNKKGETIIRVL